MRFLLTAVRKDLGRLRRDPLALATSLGIPLVLVTLISLVFSGGRATPQGRLLVADEDGTILSRTLTSTVSGQQLSKIFTIETTNREEGHRRVDRGDASALLIIPKGSQDAFLRNQPAQLQLITNPAQQILPKIAEESLATVVDGAFYFQKLGAIALQNRNTRLINLDLHVTAPRPENQNVAALFLPAMLFMGLLFVGNAYALDFWKEQSWGTLRRLASAPVSLGMFLGGRLISLAPILTIVALVGVAGMRWFARLPVANILLATLWLVLSGAAFYLFLVTIAVHASGQRAANVIGNLVVFPLSLVGGSFFPFEMMPDWMASIGRLTPNGWAVTKFKAFVAGSAHTTDFLIGAAGMAFVGSVLFFLTLRRIRKLV